MLCESILKAIEELQSKAYDLGYANGVGEEGNYEQVDVEDAKKALIKAIEIVIKRQF